MTDYTPELQALFDEYEVDNCKLNPVQIALEHLDAPTDVEALEDWMSENYRGTHDLEDFCREEGTERLNISGAEIDEHPTSTILRCVNWLHYYKYELAYDFNAIQADTGEHYTYDYAKGHMPASYGLWFIFEAN